MNELDRHIADELDLADERCSRGDIGGAFHHLERAHVLGQAGTYRHTQVHWRMLKLGFLRRDVREIAGQLMRIIGAATKTPFGIYPTGNTGGANVSPFRSMPIAPDLKEIIEEYR